MPPSRKKSPVYQFPPPAHFADPARREKLERAFPEIRGLFEKYLEEQHVPGVAFGVVIDGELAYADALGVRDVEANLPVTADTVFRIASMSKSFAAMALLKLRDEKKLRLDDPVAKYIPEFKTLVYPTADSPVITLHNLLTMSPGFPEDNPWGDRQMAITARQFTQWLRAGIPFSTAPNTAFEYSNYGYAILGRIISQVAGMPFQKYITQQILKPLGMNATVWESNRVPSDKRARGYRLEQDLATGEFGFVAQPILPDGAFAAMAGLWTTIPDFARYMSFLLDCFPPRDDAETGPVSRATAREMQQMARFESLATLQTNPETTWHAVQGYGFGLAVWHDEKYGYGVAHGGGLPGYGSYYYLLPHHGIGLVAFTNKTYSRVGQVFALVLELLAQTGGLQERAISPSAVLVETRETVQRWLDGGADDALVACAAENFFLDRDLAHRHADLDKIRTELGAFRTVGEFTVLNALRGMWDIECEKGSLHVLVTLAPTLPPTLQMLSLTVHLAEQNSPS